MSLQALILYKNNIQHTGSYFNETSFYALILYKNNIQHTMAYLKAKDCYGVNPL